MLQRPEPKREQTTVSNKIIDSVVKKEEFKRLTLASDFNPEELVLISIQDPDDKDNLDMYREWYKDELSVRFWDVEEDLGIISGGYPVTPIDDKTADKIIDFILKYRDEKFFIHCAAGQSRSAGVALALESIIKFNGDKYVTAQYPSDIKAMGERYCPNLTVYDKILERFEKRGLSIEKEFYCSKCNSSFEKYTLGTKNGKNVKFCPICYEVQ